MTLSTEKEETTTSDHHDLTMGETAKAGEIVKMEVKCSKDKKVHEQDRIVQGKTYAQICF